MMLDHTQSTRSRYRSTVTNSVKFVLVFVVVNLHVVRNLSLVLYLAIYALLAFMVVTDFVAELVRRRGAGQWSPFVVFLATAILGTLTSLLIISPAGAFAGLSRFVFSIPVFLALYAYTDSVTTLRRYVTVYVMFFAIAGLTLPMQFVTGPVSWFAEASERGGFDRYSSLIGSLTATGVVVGCYAILAQAFKPRFRIFWALLVAGPSMSSLSKAAIVNTAAGSMVLAYLNRREVPRLFLGGMVLLVMAATAYGTIPALGDRIDASIASLGLGGSVIASYDQTVSESALYRLVDLPLANFVHLADHGSPFVYLLGAGFGMASTALVPSADALAPMTHNQYAELVSVFGFFGGGALTIMLFVVLVRTWRLWKANSEQLFLTIALAYSVLLVNGAFANGILYQPAAASIFCLALFCGVAGNDLARATPPPFGPARRRLRVDQPKRSVT